MQVIRADSLGLCFGVRDALVVAHQIEIPRDVVVYGELVHNTVVADQLRERGFQQLAENRQHELPAADHVLVTAHGISDRRRRWLENAGKRLIDTTCPLVHRVHLAARKLQSEGFFVVVIGRVGHVEVRGIVEDLDEFAVVQSPADVVEFQRERIGVVCQTTTPPAMAARLQEAIVRRNPQAIVRFVDTICQPTRDRQQAVLRLAERVEAIVVVGGRNSNNTRELVELAKQKGRPAFHVEAAGGLKAEWFEGMEVVGLTAGTSTLDETIVEVQHRLEEL